jgi:DNA-binding transcriptional regulator YiaG
VTKIDLTPDQMFQIRRQLRLTQRALARELGVKQERYRAWEAGDSRIPDDLGPAMQLLAEPVPPQSPMPADAIVSLRYDLGLTMKSFAALLGTDFQTVQDWIDGRDSPSPYFLRKMHELRSSIGVEGSVPVLSESELKELRARTGLNIYKFAERVGASASEILEGESGYRMVRPRTNRALVGLRDELDAGEKSD